LKFLILMTLKPLLDFPRPPVAMPFFGPRPSGYGLKRSKALGSRLVVSAKAVTGLAGANAEVSRT
jgi:hypothetical protein